MDKYRVSSVILTVLMFFLSFNIVNKIAGEESIFVKIFLVGLFFVCIPLGIFLIILCMAYIFFKFFDSEVIGIDRVREARLIEQAVSLRMLFLGVMIPAMFHEKYKDVHKELFQHYHKRQFSQKVHPELYQHFHKRQFYRKIDEELLPVAWHPDRAVDWCFDEEKKKDLEYLFGR